MSLLSPFFGERRTSIIFAADLNSFEENARILSSVSDLVDVIKVSTALTFREGPSVYRRFHEKFGLPIFADLKVADVPHTNADIVGVARAGGASAVMVHAFVGPDGILAALDAAEGRVAIIAQLELTSPGGQVFNASIADAMAKLVSGLGVQGVQAPGNRPARIRKIREIVGQELGMVCCGVGAQGGRIRSVIAAGGDYAIVGRAIYSAQDPRQAIYDLRK